MHSKMFYAYQTVVFWTLARLSKLLILLMWLEIYEQLVAIKLGQYQLSPKQYLERSKTVRMSDIFLTVYILSALTKVRVICSTYWKIYLLRIYRRRYLFLYLISTMTSSPVWVSVSMLTCCYCAAIYHLPPLPAAYMLLILLAGLSPTPMR